jgi:LuxR family transcriptional regulator, quorum-sensing system regulator BjaR1
MKQNELFDVLYVAEEIDRATSLDQILDTLCTCLEQYGFCAFLITRLPPADESRWQEHILANCWPTEWYRHYNATGHFRHDPCVARSRRTADPFLWSEISRHGLEGPARLVMDEATEFGLRQGICVPVHAPFAPPTVVTVSGENVDLAPSARHVVGALARQALQAVRRLRTGSDDSPRPVLSEREREVMRWLADGKTAWEVSRILSLSEHTVLTHLRNAKQKLDAANNVHAVVKAFLRQEIQP